MYDTSDEETSVPKVLYETENEFRKICHIFFIVSFNLRPHWPVRPQLQCSWADKC